MDRAAVDQFKTTLEQALTAVQRHGLTVNARRDVRFQNNRRADVELTIEYAGKQLTPQVELKHHLRPATIGATLQQLRALGGQPMIVADYVAPPMADRLREQGVWFADTVGNVYLEDPPLLIWVVGRPRPKQHTQKTTTRAFQPSGLQVLFALLCKPELADQPYREIAKCAGVAHGTVGWVMAELPKMGFVAEYRKRRILVKYETLLTQWAEGYARTLRPKLQLAKYQTNLIDWWKNLDATQFDYLLGGELAGARLTKHLRPEHVTLYGDKINQKFLVKFALRPAEDGNVEILKRFWNFPEDPAGMAPAPLIYADLLATGDTRCIETAELIYKDIVDGFERQT
jgi:hypothetical protein